MLENSGDCLRYGQAITQNVPPNGQIKPLPGAAGLARHCKFRGDAGAGRARREETRTVLSKFDNPFDTRAHASGTEGMRLRGIKAGRRATNSTRSESARCLQSKAGRSGGENATKGGRVASARHARPCSRRTAATTAFLKRRDRRSSRALAILPLKTATREAFGPAAAIEKNRRN